MRLFIIIILLVTSCTHLTTKVKCNNTVAYVSLFGKYEPEGDCK